MCNNRDFILFKYSLDAKRWPTKIKLRIWLKQKTQKKNENTFQQKNVIEQKHVS